MSEDLMLGETGKTWLLALKIERPQTKKHELLLRRWKRYKNGFSLRAYREECSLGYTMIFVKKDPFWIFEFHNYNIKL
jgi:hypothetical protein